MSRGNVSKQQITEETVLVVPLSAGESINPNFERQLYRALATTPYGFHTIDREDNLACIRRSAWGEKLKVNLVKTSSLER